MIGSLGRNGHQPTIEEAKKKFAAHCDQSSNLLADLRAPVRILSTLKEYHSV